MSTKKKGNFNGQNKTNVWGMLRDIAVASLNKGQFPIAILGFIIILVIWRIPEAKLAELVENVLTTFVTFYLAGWSLFLVVTILWFYNSKSLRRAHANEMRRISTEKKDLQEQILNIKLNTSNKNK